MASEIPISTTTFKLNNGLEMPAVGYGTWQGSYGTGSPEALENTIVSALKAGYRLIDTAQHYGVEAEVGNAVRKSGIPREQITVVTKFWGHWHHDPAEALRISLESTGLDYIDVFLMHWPCAQTPDKKTLYIDDSPTYVETWKKMEPLVGPTCRAIGVSNFTEKTLDVLLNSATVVPAVNQIELHALNPNHKLVPYCQSKGIQVTSWSTLGANADPKTNPILGHEIFTGIAKAHGCAPAVVSLAWAVQRGIAVIPKSSTLSRIEANIRLPQLTDAEMALVDSAGDKIGKRRLTNTSGSTDGGVRRWQGWTDVDFGWVDEKGNWLT